MLPEAHVSPQPVFDYDRAIRVKEATHKMGLHDNPTATSANLWLYNSPNERWPKVMEKIQHLKLQEDLASETTNPLPTIGLEIEIPRKPFISSVAAHYALFFDLLGLPRNKLHINVKTGMVETYPSMWEFSTAPAYTAAVASRTLAELIKGNFIAHLEFDGQKPPTAEDRVTLLDEKLVSLHVNLGFPDWLTGHIPANDNTDVLLFGSSFALAFSSPERLQRRAQVVIANIKDAELTKKSTSLGAKRLEAKPLEVSDRQTYRLTEEMQLLATSVFTTFGRIDSPLADIWVRVRDKIDNIYKSHQIEPKIVTEKLLAAGLVGGSNIQAELRQVLTGGAHQVRKLLNSPLVK